MNRPIINIPQSASLEELRRFIVTKFNEVVNALGDINNAKFQVIRNVSAGVAPLDAVNVKQLQDLEREFQDSLNALGTSTNGLPSFKPPFSDGTALLKNAADASKLLKFDLSNLTTTTTRTATVLDENGVIAKGACILSTCTGTLGLTTSFQDIPGATLSLTKKGVWLITMSITFDVASGDGTLQGILNFDGTQDLLLITEVADTGGGTFMVTRQWLKTSTTGVEIAKLQAKKTSGIGTSGIRNTNATISALWISP